MERETRQRAGAQERSLNKQADTCLSFWDNDLASHRQSVDGAVQVIPDSEGTMSIFKKSLMALALTASFGAIATAPAVAE
ncbi:MAG: hypothetical protein VX593_00260, partial [Pseudomonadota bacterium]|nr:hypothetical protein [Pseudomonadota bacterium]